METTIKWIDTRERRPVADECRGCFYPRIFIVDRYGGINTAHLNYDSAFDDATTEPGYEPPLEEYSWSDIRYWAPVKHIALGEHSASEPREKEGV